MAGQAKKRVAIVILVRDWDSAYSVATVAKSQVRSLARNGYAPRVLALEGCPPWEHEEAVDYRPCLPRFEFEWCPGRVEPEFAARVRLLADRFEEHLEGIDVVITHDVAYLRQFLHYNAAMRELAPRLPSARWLHWCHSSPFPRPTEKAGHPHDLLHSPMQGARFVGLARTHRSGLARMFGVPVREVATVPNSRATPDFLGLHPLSLRIAERSDILSADIVNVLPTALGRFSKQHEICIYLMAALKEQGKSVALVFANPHAVRPLDQARLLHLRWLADRLGLGEREVLFTSEVHEGLSNGCPEPVVRDLLQLSNVFILPSLGESSSLLVMEAALSKTLCVLNRRLGALRELGGRDVLWIDCEDLSLAIQQKYGVEGKAIPSFYYHRYYEDRRRYYRSCARRVLDALQRDKALAFFTRIRKSFEEQAIFENRLRALIEG